MITVETLAGGLRLVTEQMADARSVCLGFWVGTGSRDEREPEAGSSHFLEHLLFKGTERWSARAIAEAVDEVGGDFNAYTTREYTAFYMRLLAADVALGLDILTDVICDPRLDGEDVDAERDVILEEIGMHADEPSDAVADRCMAALFPDHTLGREVLGSTETVSAATPEAIQAFFATHYGTGNMVAAVAGACGHAEMAGALADRMAAREAQRPERDAPGHRVDPLSVERRETEQAHLVLGMRSLDRFDERRYAAAVYNRLLGGGVSSRLFQEIREHRSLAYSVWSDRSAFEDTGALSVGLSTSLGNVDEALAVTVGIIEDLASGGLNAREVEVARKGIAAELVLAGEDSGARMSRIGASLLLHGEVLEVGELLARIEAVAPEDVAEVASLTAAAPRVLAAVGPFDAGRFDAEKLGLGAR